METAITLETIYEAIQTLQEYNEQQEQQDTNKTIKDIADSLYYYDYSSDENGTITATRINRIDELNTNLENVNSTLNHFLALALVLITSVVLIKTFFTGW
ncbi:MAG: hypothetical protein ACI4DK_12685 [Lachnospiraceae bacterium]